MEAYDANHCGTGLMIDFFFLVPIAIGMGLAGLASFMWTLKSGQYDDLEGAAQRILFEGNEGPFLEEHLTPSTRLTAEASVSDFNDVVKARR
jgi:cbb3-type cytochrome oxidase maturation protein